MSIATAPTNRFDIPAPATEPLPSPDAPLFPVALTGPDFDRLPRSLRRWTPEAIWRRIRQPYRMWKRTKRLAWVTRPFRKAPLTARPPDGPTLIMSNLSGKLGLSRGALYDIQHYILPFHKDVTYINVGQSGGRPIMPDDWDPRKRFSHVYMHGMPEFFSKVWPILRPEQIADAWRVGCWVWETDQFPERFRHGLDLVHEVWIPAAFAGVGLRKGTDIPITVKPYGIEVDMSVPPLPRSRFGVPEDAFLGVAIMDLISCPHRKNPWAHIVAWQKAFGRDPRAVLIMKVRSESRTEVVLHEMAEMIDGAPNIKIVDEWFSPEEITGFQRMADVYVSLHRSEGYGLNIHECLMMGVPVVATHWSANTEFGPNYPHYHGVPATLVPYSGDWLYHYPGPSFTWAEADTDAAARVLRRLALDKAGGRT